MSWFREGVDPALLHRCTSGHASFRIADVSTPCGWTATVDEDACIGCGLWPKVCPSEDCIRIRQTMPMRESIHENFLVENRFDLKIGY